MRLPSRLLHWKALSEYYFTRHTFFCYDQKVLSNKVTFKFCYTFLKETMSISYSFGYKAR
jgi:hypothetical protein